MSTLREPRETGRLTARYESGIVPPTQVSNAFGGVIWLKQGGSSGEPKKKRRRGYSSIDAIDPTDGGRWQVLLPDTKMDYVAAQGLGAAMELADTVRWALLHPRAVFRGVRDLERDVSEDKWLCYVATPSHAYDHKTGEKCPPWPGEVFLVFVTEEQVLYNWYWYACDGCDSHLPADYDVRFLEKVL